MASNEFLPLPYVKKILGLYGSRLVVLGDSERSDLLIYSHKKGIFFPWRALATKASIQSVGVGGDSRKG